jgi:hypothetical protein
MAKSISRRLADSASPTGAIDGTLSTAAQTNITSVGTLSSLVIADGATIGSASDTNSITISSAGVVTLDQIPVFSAGINVSGGSIAGTLSTAAQTNITSVGTLSALAVSGTSTLAGNVGIGTTSPNSYSGYTALTLNHATNGGLLDFELNGNLQGEIYANSANLGLGLQAVGNRSIQFETNGTIRATIDGSGNVGIGTTSPRSVTNYSVVGINGTSGSAIDFELGEALKTTFTQTAGQFEINVVPALPLIFKTSNTEAMRIDSAGNLLVGGTSLNAASSVGFTAAGQIRQVFASGVANDSLFGAISGVSNGFQIIQDTSNNQKYIFHNGGTPSVTIDASGNVGIGTTTNDAGIKLDVRGNVRIGDGSTAEQDILFANSNTEWQVGLNNAGNGTDGNHFYFWEGSTYRLTIQKGGNVGIGTASPSEKLHVFGGAAGSVFRVETASGQYTYQGSDAIGTYIEQVGTTAATRKFRLQSSDGGSNYTQVIIDGSNRRVEVIPALDVHQGAVWSATAQGAGKGTIHLDPAITTDHAGSSITFGASDHASGTSAQAGIYTASDGSYGTKMYIATTNSYAAGSKTAIAIDHLGNANFPRGYITSQVPGFNVYYNTNAFTPSANTVFPHNTTRYNNGGHFNTSTYRFTAPIAGIYHFHFHTIYYGSGANAAISLRVNAAGQSGTNTHFSANEGAVWHTINITTNLDLAENDYVDIMTNSMGNMTYLHGTTWNEFSGYLVG